MLLGDFQMESNVILKAMFMRVVEMEFKYGTLVVSLLVQLASQGEYQTFASERKGSYMPAMKQNCSGYNYTAMGSKGLF